MSDELDDLIGSIQRAKPRLPKLDVEQPSPPPEAPVVVPSAVQRLTEISEEMKALQAQIKAHALQLAKNVSGTLPPGYIRFHYRPILGNDHWLGHIPDEKLGPFTWKELYQPDVVSKLRLQTPKDRENLGIGLALQVGACKFPNTLFHFEWHCPTLGKIFVHHLPPEGFVRG